MWQGCRGAASPGTVSGCGTWFPGGASECVVADPAYSVVQVPEGVCDALAGRVAGQVRGRLQAEPGVVQAGDDRVETFLAEENPFEAMMERGTVFSDVEAVRWDEKLYALDSPNEVRAFCRHNFIPVERAESVDIPLWLTKRGVLVRATKNSR